MHVEIDHPFKRGQTFYGGTPTDAAAHANLLGKLYAFDDYAAPVGSNPPVLRSGAPVICMLVQNTSGSAIAPKMLCEMKNDGTTSRHYLGEVMGISPTVGDRCFPADEHLPAAGVADDDFFFVVVSGPAMCVTDSAGDTTIGVGHFVVPGAGTAGRVVGQATSEDDADIFPQIQGAVGRCIAAIDATSTNILIYVTMK